MSKALLIGIDYPDSPNSLPGCIHDINDVRNMLITYYKYLPENIVMLCDISGQDPSLLPTKANILSNLKNIIQASVYCSQIWIHYSGHGAQIIDVSDNLPDYTDLGLGINNLTDSSYNYFDPSFSYLYDSLDSQTPNNNTITDISSIIQLENQFGVEDTSANSDIIVAEVIQQIDPSNDPTTYLEDIIVPSDYQTDGIITSHDIFAIIRKSKCTTFALFDCCNSATICDLPWTFTFNNALNTYVTSRTKSIVLENPNIFALSGCKDNQTSSDIYNTITHQYNGLLTQSLLACLKNNNYQCTISKLYTDICKMIIDGGYSQNPVLSSSVAFLKYTFTIPPTSLVSILAEKSIQPTNLNTNKHGAKNLGMNIPTKPRTNNVMKLF